MEESVQNVYLDEVLEQQVRVDQELKRKAAPSTPPLLSRGRRQASSSPEGSYSSRAIDYRITGFWRWRTVVVPPNVYVVHTRRGRQQPLHLGLGISFGFDPETDAFLVIPAAVQTILINARCICVERQGILVQAYVQWIIDDLETAYRKLDFSDPEDPMRIVNVQLREQAEAAIKDKVATMSIDDVLSDKQPIIEELTHRLRTTAEGSRDNDRGLGLKIVTVQIKEAVVSSARLWESLQKLFRAERDKLARMAELQAQQAIMARELENRHSHHLAELESQSQLAERQAEKDRERYDREQTEASRRRERERLAEEERIAHRLAVEASRQESDLELALKEQELKTKRLQGELEPALVELQLRLEQNRAERDRLLATLELELAELRHRSELSRQREELEVLRQRRELENQVSEGLIRSQLVASLPDLAAALPAPHELRHISVHSNEGGPLSSLAGLLAGAVELVETLKSPPAGGDRAGKAPAVGPHLGPD